MTERARDQLITGGFSLVFCAAMVGVMLPVSRWSWLAGPVILYLLLPAALLGLASIALAEPAARASRWKRSGGAPGLHRRASAAGRHRRATPARAART